MGIRSSEYFYYGSIRKLVTVFGAMFNNIHIGRQLGDGTLSNMERVPLSYGPRSKFLARIRERKREDNISIRLPRMSFAISGIQYDTNSKLKKNNTIRVCDPPGKAWGAAPYNITFDLEIYGRTQDDMFQIVEQILPMFNPDYTVSIKGLEGPQSVTSVPFVLSGVSLNDNYEGDLNPSRELIYTLTFGAKIKFLGPIDTNAPIILTSTVSMYDTENENFFQKSFAKGNEDEEITIEEISFVDSRDEFRLILDSYSSLPIPVGTEIVGQTSLYGGIVKSNNGMDIITVTHLDNLLLKDENIVDVNGNVYNVLDIERVDNEEV